jgi:4-hydroxy 2-oxovalerate aldolase
MRLNLGNLHAYAGVYSSFLSDVEKAAEEYGIDTHTILFELGRCKMVGGQIDMIVDVALDLLKGRGPICAL